MRCRRLSGGDITGGFASGDEAIAQTVGCELKFIFGEWFLDTSKGIPWLPMPNASATPILGRFPADLGRAEALVKAAILSVDGVKEITAFSIAFNHDKRTCAISATVTTENDGTFTVMESIP